MRRVLELCAGLQAHMDATGDIRAGVVALGQIYVSECQSCRHCAMHCLAYLGAALTRAAAAHQDPRARAHALSCLQKALLYSRATSERGAEGRILVHLASAHEMLGPNSAKGSDAGVAAAYRQAALSAAQEAVWSSGAGYKSAAVLLKNLGAVHDTLRPSGKAVELYRQAAEFARYDGDRGLGLYLTELRGEQLRLGRLSDAAKSQHEVIRVNVDPPKQRASPPVGALRDRSASSHPLIGQHDRGAAFLRIASNVRAAARPSSADFLRATSQPSPPYDRLSGRRRPQSAKV